MKKLIMLAIVMGLLMSGCASAGGHWVKPDVTWEQYKLDKYDCEAIVSQQTKIMGITPVGKGFRYCMEKRGYKWEVTK